MNSRPERKVVPCAKRWTMRHILEAYQLRGEILLSLMPANQKVLVRSRDELSVAVKDALKEVANSDLYSDDAFLEFWKDRVPRYEDAVGEELRKAILSNIGGRMHDFILDLIYPNVKGNDYGQYARLLTTSTLRYRPTHTEIAADMRGERYVRQPFRTIADMSGITYHLPHALPFSVCRVPIGEK